MEKKTISNVIKTIVELAKVGEELGYKDNLQSILYAVSRGVDIDNIIKYIPPHTSIERSKKIINALILKYPEEIINAIIKFDISSKQIELILKYPEYNYVLLEGDINFIALLNMEQVFYTYKNDKEFIHYSLRKENIGVYQNMLSFNLLRKKYVNMGIEAEIKTVIYRVKQILNIHDDIEYEYSNGYVLSLIIPNKYHLRFKHSKLDLNDILKGCKYIRQTRFMIKVKEREVEEEQNTAEPFTYENITEWKGKYDGGPSYSSYKRKLNRTAEVGGVEISPKQFDDLSKYYDVTAKSKLSDIIDSYEESIDYDLDRSDYRVSNRHKKLTKESDIINQILKEFGY